MITKVEGVDPARSSLMGRVKQSHTLPELRVRKALHKLGFRFRLHRRDLPGRPDIVLPRHKTVVFVHGCFWHRHEGCGKASTPKTRVDFWQSKFEANILRDRQNAVDLDAKGWRVVVVWECEAAKKEALVALLDSRLKVAKK